MKLFLSILLVSSVLVLNQCSKSTLLNDNNSKNPTNTTQVFNITNDDSAKNFIADYIKATNNKDEKKVNDSYLDFYPAKNIKLDNLIRCEIKSLDLSQEENLYEPYYALKKFKNIKIYNAEIFYEFKDETKEPSGNGVHPLTFVLTKQGDSWKFIDVFFQ